MSEANMPLTREQKQNAIEDLKEKINKQKSIVFVDFSGINSKQNFELRDKLKEAGCLFKVVKKTLLKIAFEKCKIPFWQKMKEDIPGQIALIFGFEEENESPKITYEFLKENKNLKILGGLFENNFKDTEEVITLAKLPSRQELLGKLTGTISAPISNFVSVLRGNIKGLITVLTKVKT